MTVGYSKVYNTAEGYVVQQPLSPRLQVFNANLEILGVLGELTLINVADQTTRTFRLPVATKPGQQCAIKSIASIKTGIVNVLASFDYDNGYQQNLIAGQADAPNINSFKLGTNPGECAVFVSGLDTTNPLRVNWHLAAYHDAAVANTSFYKWVWANAAQRLATLATANDIGGIGYQTDIAREFKLLALTGGAPLRWGRVPATDVEHWHLTLSRCTENARSDFAWSIGGAGSTGGILPTPTDAIARLSRVQYSTGSVAVNLASYFWSNDGTGAPLLGGWRYFFEFGLERSDSPDVRWFVGLKAQPNPSGNVDYGTFTNIFGIGRNAGQANTQLMRNDGAGNAVLTDLGSAFPALSRFAYQAEFYFAPDGDTYAAYNIRNKDTNAEVSGSFTTELPIKTIQMNMNIFVCNNQSTAQNIISHAATKAGQIAY